MTEEEFRRLINRLANQYWIRFFRHWKEGFYHVSAKDFNGEDVTILELSSFERIDIGSDPKLLLYQIPRKDTQCD